MGKKTLYVIAIALFFICIGCRTHKQITTIEHVDTTKVEQVSKQESLVDTTATHTTITTSDEQETTITDEVIKYVDGVISEVSRHIETVAKKHNDSFEEAMQAGKSYYVSDTTKTIMLGKSDMEYDYVKDTKANPSGTIMGIVILLCLILGICICYKFYRR